MQLPLLRNGLNIDLTAQYTHSDSVYDTVPVTVTLIVSCDCDCEL